MDEAKRQEELAKSLREKSKRMPQGSRQKATYWS